MVKGLAYFTLFDIPGKSGSYVRVLCPSGSYNAMGGYATPELARAIVREMYHTWAWELTASEFEARLKAREAVRA